MRPGEGAFSRRTGRFAGWSDLSDAFSPVKGVTQCARPRGCGAARRLQAVIQTVRPRTRKITVRYGLVSLNRVQAVLLLWVMASLAL